MTLELPFWQLLAKNGVFASADSVLKTVNPTRLVFQYSVNVDFNVHYMCCFFLCLTLCLHLRGVVEKKDNFIEKVNVWFIDASESLAHLQDWNLLTVFSVTY